MGKSNQTFATGTKWSRHSHTTYATEQRAAADEHEAGEKRTHALYSSVRLFVCFFLLFCSYLCSQSLVACLLFDGACIRGAPTSGQATDFLIHVLIVSRVCVCSSSHPVFSLSVCVCLSLSLRLSVMRVLNPSVVLNNPSINVSLFSLSFIHCAYLLIVQPFNQHSQHFNVAFKHLARVIARIRRSIDLIKLKA